jgi:3-hydroxyisobutyrate dehydrogenase-like beta-hydroxyacid dehydrogenase
MGTVMAARLLAATGELTVWNRTGSKCAPLVQQGARQVDALTDLAGCDVVFTCVTRSEDLLEVTCGAGGLLAGERTPRIVVDCSTVSAEASATVRAEAADRGVRYLAAPISGNPDMVREGAAALAVSGPAEVVEELTVALHAIAPTVVPVGDGEEARLVKICHNLLLGVITQALAEVTSLAEKAGVSSDAFLSFLDASVLGSPWLHHKGRAIAARDYTPTFSSRNLRKDFDIGMAAARGLEVPMSITASTQQLLQTAIGRGLGDLDYVALYDLQAAGAALPDDRP